MPFINFATKEINCKIVYYGPGLSGKTTNIKWIYEHVKPENRGELVTLATETERTLFFDFVPIEISDVKGFKVRFHLYTTPGQIIYQASRKLILKGVDGIVFVADSQEERHDANLDTLDDMIENLEDYGIDIKEIPLVFQYNKRDLPNVLPIEILKKDLNRWKCPDFEAIAIKGIGVLETFKEITKQVLRKLKK
ncbi:mutual gliding protein A [Desulfurobacterium thermolithotrophum DSM 11699]|uniref:Mutual gliding protein A n=1 Tax=Desulfurobacterium thermolithotrophum (strain DSM 11699 / BSA) TaxID=868864 RepID=F0S024_DESTD|nr:GTPase domain-containing protein [Desulfurobacterium thermolithotrophum]ADY73705.1 mutual gliding protein A [Desulfurobacterium thermolithotrophum DSM 11699]